MNKTELPLRIGLSYKFRLYYVMQTLDKYAKSGLSNREVYRKYIYPVLGISEKTMYNMINNSCKEKYQLTETEKHYFKQSLL